MTNDGYIILNQHIDCSYSSFKFKEIKSPIYIKDGRIGINRMPLHKYNFDIATPTDNTMTALHIGDGVHGFSMGNGTQNGFVPEIIGVGSDEDDAGLYFIGVAGNDVSSDIPLIVMDARNMYKQVVNNRPLFGITSANYNEYILKINSSNDLELKGKLLAQDVEINNSSLLEIITDLQKQINELKAKIT